MGARISVLRDMRKLRFVPEGGTLVDITNRTIQGRFLFRPSRELNDIVLGVLGRAQRLHPVRVCHVVVLSNHIHLLLDVDNAQQVADFMEYVNGNLAREVNRLTGWSGPLFERRYTMILVSNEEAAQVERFKYSLSQGCKENLVERTEDWPGVHSVRALLEGEPLTGHWFSRTEESAARRRGEEFDPLQYATPEALVLSRLPCWKHLSPEQYRVRVSSLVSDIDREAAIARASTGHSPLGREAILTQDPHHRPERIAKSPAPFVHAASKAARLALYEAYSWFVAAYRTAAEKLRGGDRTVCFPAGSFPPALPFVPG
jgi:REP element-mobilizing transposase RayT